MLVGLVSWGKWGRFGGWTYFGHDDGDFSADYLDELQLSIVSFVSSDVAWIWGCQNRSVGLIGTYWWLRFKQVASGFGGQKEGSCLTMIRRNTDFTQSSNMDEKEWAVKSKLEWIIC